MIRVIVADDSEVFRSTLSQLIERYPARLIAEVANGLDAVKAAEQEQPDLFILDVSMPIMDGFIAAQNLKARYPHVPIIMISGMMDTASKQEAFRCGAQGCVHKLTAYSELIPAIRAVLSGGRYVPQ